MKINRGKQDKHKQCNINLMLIFLIFFQNINHSQQTNCGGFQYEDEEGICQDCDSQRCDPNSYCTESSFNCSGCVVESYLQFRQTQDTPVFGFCITQTECEEQYAGYPEGKFCTSCGDTCKPQTGTKTCENIDSVIYCYQCAENNYLTPIENESYGLCDEECGYGYYQDEDNFLCLDCDSSCVTQTSQPTCSQQNNKCSVCQAGLYKQSEQDYDYCLNKCEDPNTYPVQHGDYFICQSCDQQACYIDNEEDEDGDDIAQCKNTSTNCLSCWNGYYKQNPDIQYSECKQLCDDLTRFPVIVSIYQYECQKCNIECKQTDNDGQRVCLNQSNLCYACADGYYKQNNIQYAECKLACPDNMYPDSNNVCQSCDMVACTEADPATTTCQSESNLCQSCKGIYYKQDITQSFSYCETECPHGYFKDSSQTNNNQCIPCSSTCDFTISSSIDVCQGASDLCYACSSDGGTILYKQDENYSQCLSTCPDDKYRDNDNLTCQSCDESICNINIQNVKICASATSCYQCISPYYKQDPSQLHSECELTCNDYNRYQNSITLTNQICSECSGTCQDTNPDRMCSINDGTECRSCSQLTQNSLYLQNPLQQYSQCLSSCPYNSYQNTNTYECDLCDTNYCANQDGENMCKYTDRTCFKCKNGYKEFEEDGVYGYCLDSCPDEYVEIQIEPDNFVCRKCDSTCDFNVNGRVCDENDTSMCSACKQGVSPVLYKMYSQTGFGQCVEECPITSYYDGENLLCVLCNTVKCETQESDRYCIGESTCKTCKDPYYKYDSDKEYSQCVLECPQGYFKDTTQDGNVCQKCDDSCDSTQPIVCIGQSNLCYSCSQNTGVTLYLQSDAPSTCLETCPDEKYISDYTCMPCDTEICDPSVTGPVCQGSATNCQFCLDPLFKVNSDLLYSSCDGDCEKYQLPEIISNQCVNCHPSCGNAPEPYFNCRDQYDSCYVCSQDEENYLYKQSTLTYDKCLSTCSNQQYKNNADFICEYCDMNVCVSLTTQMCEDSSTKCAQCKEGYFKKYYQQKFSDCVLEQDCPNGTLAQYLDGEGYVCYPCSEKCDISITIGQVCQDTIDKCQKCSQDMAEPLFLQDTTDDYSTCQTECSYIKYKNYDLMSCELCDLNACVDTSGDSKHSCVDQNNLCRFCKGNYYKQEENSEYSFCLEDYCPLNTLKTKQSNNNICQQCDSSCDLSSVQDGENVCKDSIYNCFQCSDGYFRKSQYDQYTECVETCPDNTYKDYDTQTCIECSSDACTDLNEQMCNGSPLQCKQCKGSYYKSESQTYALCVLDCDYDQIKVTEFENNTCEYCDDTCDLTVKNLNINACSGSSTSCYKCSQEKSEELYKQVSTNTYSSCLNTCPLSKYKDNINYTCEQCDMNICADMSDQNIQACKSQSNLCYQCQGEYYKQDPDLTYSLCLKTCPTNTYKVTQFNNNICQQCDQSCEQEIDGENVQVCQGSSDLCFQCSQDYGNAYKQIYEDTYSKCVSDCPNNRFIDQDTLSCQKCDMSLCVSFDGKMCQGFSNYCQMCKTGYYKLNENEQFSECVAECPNQFLPQTQTNNSICKECDHTCKQDIDTMDTERVCQTEVNYCNTCNQNTIQGNLYLSNGKYSECITNCPNNKYADQNTFMCVACDLNVCTLTTDSNTCYQDSQKCQKCKGEYAKQSSNTYDFCVQNCPLDTIKVQIDTDNNICSECDTTCDSSVQDDGEQVCYGGTNLCFKCNQSNKLLYLQKQGSYSLCLETCPNHKYKDSDLMECVECDLTKCYLNVDNQVCYKDKCNQCVNGYYKQDPDQYFSECEINCPNWALPIDEDNNGTCQSCSETCDYSVTDPVCSGDLDLCFSCNKNLQLYKLNNDGYSQCVENCPKNKYKDGENMVCLSCDTTICAEVENDEYMCFGSATTCRYCKGDYYKLQIDQIYSTCVETCPDNYLAVKNLNNNYCKKCDDTCETNIPDGERVCYGETNQCYQCVNGLYKQNSQLLYDQCVDECDIDQFMNTNTQECQACNTNACSPIETKQCVISEFHCSQCKGAYYKTDPSQEYSDCIQTCPAGYIGIILSYDNTCQKCDSTCDFDVSGDVCSGSTTQCQKCSQAQETLYLQDPNESYSQCKSTCPNSSYQDSSTFSCQPCDTNKCTTLSEQMCSGSSSNCKQCKNTYLKTDPNSEFSECVSDCPNNYLEIYQTNNNYCQKCDDSCDQTITGQPVCQNSINLCYECSQSTGKDLFKQVYSLSQPYQICLEDCSFSKYKDYSDFTCKSCDTTRCVIYSNDYSCDGESYTCKSCKGIYYKQDQNQIYSDCLETCPEGYFKTKDENNYNVCSECDNTYCDSSYIPMCQGTSQKCQKCKNGFYKLYPESQYSICSQTCNDGYYKNSSTNECTECEETCLTCNGPNNDDCLTCDTNYYLNQQTGECLQDCDSVQQTYPNIDTNICESCYIGCTSCFGPNQSQCYGCIFSALSIVNDPDALPLTYTCYELECGTGYYKNSNTDTCEPCSGDCQNCQNDEDTCISCPTNYNLYNGECLEGCPYYTYEKKNGICENCNPSCYSCNGPNYNDCTACDSSLQLKLENGQCECPDGTYWNESSLVCLDYVSYSVTLQQGSNYNSLPVITIQFEEALVALPSLQQISITIDGLTSSGTISQYSEAESRRLLSNNNYDFEAVVTDKDSDNTYYQITIELFVSITSTQLHISTNFIDLETKSGHPFESNSSSQKSFDFTINQVFLKERNQNLSDYFLNIADALDDTDFTYIVAKIGIFVFFFNYIVLLAIPVIIDTLLPEAFYNLSRIFAVLVFGDCVHWNTGTSEFNDFDTDYDQTDNVFKKVGLYANFLMNGYIQFFVVLLVWIIFGIFKFTYMVKEKQINKKQQLQVDELQNSSLYKGYTYFSRLQVRLYDVFLFYFSLYILLQLKNPTFVGYMNIGGFVCAILTGISYFICLFFVLKAINIAQNQSKRVKMESLFGILINDIKLNDIYEQSLNQNFIVRNYRIINFLKKIGIVAVITFVHTYPKGQIIAISGILLLSALYTVSVRPFRPLIQNILKILADFSIAAAYIVLILSLYKYEKMAESIVLDEDDLDTYALYSQVMVWLFLAFLLLHLIIASLQLFFKIHDLITDYNQEKVSYLNSELQSQYGKKPQNSQYNTNIQKELLQDNNNDENNNNIDKNNQSTLITDRSQDLMISQKSKDEKVDDYYNIRQNSSKFDIKKAEDQFDNQQSPKKKKKQVVEIELQNQKNKKKQKKSSGQLSQKLNQEREDEDEKSQNSDELENSKEFSEKYDIINKKRQKKIAGLLVDSQNRNYDSYDRDPNIQNDQDKNNYFMTGENKIKNSPTFKQYNSLTKSKKQSMNQIVYKKKIIVVTKYIFNLEIQQSLKNTSYLKNNKNSILYSIEKPNRSYMNSHASFDSVSNIEDDTIFKDKKIQVTGQILYSAKVNENPDDDGFYDILPTYTQIDPYYLQGNQLKETMKIFDKLKIQDDQIFIEKEERLNLTGLNMDPKTREILFSQDLLFVEYFVRIDGKRKKYKGSLNF